MNVKIKKYYSITIITFFGLVFKVISLVILLFYASCSKDYSMKDQQVSPQISDSMDKSIQSSLHSQESIHLTEFEFNHMEKSLQ